MNTLISKKTDDTYIFLNVDDREYMISAQYVVQILELPYLEIPQKLPLHVLGLLEFNSTFINVIDLRSMFNIQRKQYSVKAKIVILEFDDFPFAIAVDDVLIIKKIDRNLIKNAPFDTKNTIIKQIYSNESENSTLVISTSELVSYLKSILLDAKFEEKPVSYLPSDEKSMQILNNRAHNFKTKKVVVNYSILDDVNQFVTFKVQNEFYSVKNLYIKGFYLMNKLKITKVPCTPSFVLGLLNFRGDYVAVIDLKAFFSRGRTEINDNTIVVVLDTENYKFAFIADEIGHVLNVNNNAFLSNKDSELVEYVENNQIYSVLNIEQILKNKRLEIR